jgi:hypothetical protein
MSARSEKTSSRRVTPSTAAHVTDKLAQDFEALRTHFRNCILSGGFNTPTTGSTQASGAAGATDWNVNHTDILAVVNGTVGIVAAAADYDVHSGSVYTGLTAASKSAIATAVIKNVSGTLSLAIVKGTAAATGSQVAPTDAEITASVGSSNTWVKVAELTINRTADTTVTQSQDNGKRPLPGLTEDLNFGDYSDIADG